MPRTMSMLVCSLPLLTAFTIGVFVADVRADAPYGDAPAAPKVPADVKGKDGVKAYLLAVAAQCKAASVDLKTHADAYNKLIDSYHGDYAAAAQKDGSKIAELVLALRSDYRRMDSFGYEYIEGIVAGVPSLSGFDTELDAGVPSKDAKPDDKVASIKITAGKLIIDREGSLNNFLVEPTVYGTNPRFVGATVDVKGLSDKPVGLPNAALIVALANYAVDGYARLFAASQAWQPTDKDCFTSLAAMTPTLADYFEDWKESKLTGYASGGRFTAVSRVSDMRGIMSSTRLIWQGLADEVKPGDAALAQNVSQGYDQILSFIDTVDAREHHEKLTVEQIDALGSQAKEKADKLTAQVTEAAALLKIDVSGAK
jgi:hypothetical protein